MLASFSASAFAQSSSESPATKVASPSAIDEVAATLSRALDKIEAQTAQISLLNALVASQQKTIETLEKRDESRVAEIAALNRVLDAEVALRKTETARADLAEKRIVEVQGSAKTAAKRAKFAFVSGFVAGAAATRLF